MPVIIGWSGKVSAADAGALHLRLDNFLQMLDELHCPVTDSQRIELGRLHSYIEAVDVKGSQAEDLCLYTRYLVKCQAETRQTRC